MRTTDIAGFGTPSPSAQFFSCSYGFPNNRLILLPCSAVSHCAKPCARHWLIYFWGVGTFVVGHACLEAKKPRRPKCISTYKRCKTTDLTGSSVWFWVPLQLRHKRLVPGNVYSFSLLYNVVVPSPQVIIWLLRATNDNIWNSTEDVVMVLFNECRLQRNIKVT